MDEPAQAGRASGSMLSDSNGSPDFGFLPQNLRSQCRSLIESYHGLHGYGCLPDILWKAGLGPFIEIAPTFATNSTPPSACSAFVNERFLSQPPDKDRLGEPRQLIGIK